jgi:ABC-2 type transport system permease protein
MLTGVALRSEMQYRLNVVAGILGGVLLQCVGLGFIATVLTRFGTLGGWTLSQLTLLYGMRLTAHALWVIPCASLFQIGAVLRDAEFDRFLTRPVNPLIQVMTRRATITTLGHAIGGLAVLTIGMVGVDVEWTVWRLLLLVLALIGGALIELSVQLLFASLSFRLHNLTDLMLAFDHVFNTFGNYPTKIFTGVTRWGLTTVFPLAFAFYFPAAILLGRTDELWVSKWIAAAAPAAGLVLFALAYRVWRAQTSHYSSAGH